MNRKQLFSIIAVLLLLVVSGAAVLVLFTKRNQATVPVSAVQMFSFNSGLEPEIRDDAYRTTYQIFVYSFCDSNGDGIGDLNGIRSKLDYIRDLGFDEIWLTPVHPSPTYHKYDVTDYFGIDPEFGSLEDYDLLLQECHERGIRVLMDLVVNHTAYAHEWFQKAADYLHELPEDWEPDSSYCPYFDYYQFSREPKDGYAPLQDTNWYYEARFWSGMPDLNLDSPVVREEIQKIASFWFERGVDGFRLDAVTSYHTGDPEANVGFMKWFCQTCRSLKPDCYIVGEAWTDRNAIAKLYESGIDSLFDFPFAGNEGIIRNTVVHSVKASDYVNAMVSLDEQYRSSNPNYIDAPFYTNHDMARSAGYYALDEGPETKMAYALSLLMSGNSFVYYGEEIGMKGSGKDENKRAPMYWSDSPDDSDLCAGPPDMDEVKMKFQSVADQMTDDLSILNWFREVIAVRNAFPVIARGRVEATNISTDTVAAFYKVSPDERNVLIIINLGDEEVSCDLSSEADGYSMVAVLNTSEEWITLEEKTLMLPGHSIAVFAEDLA